MGRILIVEDCHEDAELLRRQMRRMDMAVFATVVGSAEEAWQYLQQQGPYASADLPDLIILDIELPGKNGDDLFASIRQTQRLKDIPVVFLTNRSDVAFEPGQFKPDITKVFRKPESAVELVGIVRQSCSFALEHVG